uniref:uncharacterized protein LOC124064250 n=1 Tax=Scatophagus argus TaxID=75038 RepID=UPI001ED7D251|nr:uncharacterized protein LOC124064250 [Scatophagus argus]
MFVLIWLTLLVPVGRGMYCSNGFCISLNEEDITAEAGLCALIPCSFTTPYNSLAQNIVWSKCEPYKQRCGDSDMIFHSNKNNRKIQPAFRGRVSLLEPDVNQKNCSIIVNDLTKSDSGLYQLRLNGWVNYKQDGYTFSQRASVSVKDLVQKPTVVIPPLTAGQQTTLTCTAPGLCSGSYPQITWTWGGAGENDSHIGDNITVFNTENVTAVTQRHSSTLTFNTSVEHHGTSVTCKVSFANSITTEETVTLNVSLSPKILNSGCEVQSEVLACVCVSEAFPLPIIKWPLLESHTEYSATTTVSKHTVTSTVTLTIKDHSNTTVECVSSNEVGEVQQIINIVSASDSQEGPVQQRGPCSTVLPWTIAAVSLAVNVICIICTMLLWYVSKATSYFAVKPLPTQWRHIGQHASRLTLSSVRRNTRRKVKTNGEDRTYMSLQKTNRSPEYDVIGQHLNKRRTVAQKGPVILPQTLLHKGGNKKVMTGAVSSDQKHFRETREGERDRKRGPDCLGHQIRMFALIWVALAFFLNTGSVQGGIYCSNGFCIRLNEEDITAEAGLCALIPCSFTTPYYFLAQNIVWSKCEPYQQRCGDSDMIFHSNKNNRKIQPAFRGRVSLLEPDVSQNNCSIIVNDLTKSDSGLYQLRLNGWVNYKQDGYTFSQRATVSVKDLVQKPTVVIPPLTAGQQTTLTCTAPGLCSGSYPQITWTWGGAGENDSHIGDNITVFNTENVNAVTQRHSSTLTFNTSAEHHGTSVTCKVSFANGITTEETVTLSVNYVKEVKISGNPSMKEGETLNLTCSVESFPPSLITWTKLHDKNMQNGTETNLRNDTLTDLQNDTGTLPQEGTGTFSLSNMTAADSGQYVCTAKYLNNTLMEKANVTVIYMRKPVIAGDTAVVEGDTLNLTCSVESFPPSYVTWTALDPNTNLHNEPSADVRSDTGSATLLMHKVTRERSGRYICTVQHMDMTLTVFADVTVTLFPKISKNSGCEVQSEVLTCTCISEGLPSPTIKWPLLESHTEYCVITTVSNHTVNSTVTLNVKDHSNTAVECVSSNENGEAKENLTITEDVRRQGQATELSKTLSWLEGVIGFLIGILLSGVIFCLVTKCRRKQKSSCYLDATLEMVASQEDPLIDAGHTVEDKQTYYQEAAEEEEGSVAAEEAALDLNGAPKDVEYASIDFSVLKRKNPRKAAKMQESTETEYAEIKKQVKEERDENWGEEGDMLEGDEEEAMRGEEEEEEEGEDMAVYSNVKDIMGEI